MNTYEVIAEDFQQVLELVSISVDELVEPLERAVESQRPLLGEHKILAAATAPGAAVAQLFSIGLVHRFEQERPALPAMSLSADGATLTAIGTSSNPRNLLARQVRAMGQAGDMLLAVAASDNNGSMIQAMRAAHDREMLVVMLSGGDCATCPA